MGNNLCYKSGNKYHDLVNRLLNQEYINDRNSKDPIISEFLSYIQNDLEKLEEIANPVLDKVKSSNHQRTEQEWTVILNAFQLFEMIFAHSQTISQSQIGLSEFYGNSHIKLKNKTFKAKENSLELKRTILAYFLGFQRKVFRAMRRILKRLPKDKVNIPIEMAKLLIRNWAAVFRVWKMTSKITFSKTVISIFEDSLLQYILIYPSQPNEVIPFESEVGDLLAVLPMRVFIKAKEIIFKLINKCLKSRQNTNEFSTALSKLCGNIISANEPICLDLLYEFFLKQGSDHLKHFVLISRESVEMERGLLSFCLCHLNEDPIVIELLIKLLGQNRGRPLNASLTFQLSEAISPLLSQIPENSALDSLFMSIFNKLSTTLGAHIGYFISCLLLKLSPDSSGINYLVRLYISNGLFRSSSTLGEELCPSSFGVLLKQLSQSDPSLLVLLDCLSVKDLILKYNQEAVRLIEDLLHAVKGGICKLMEISSNVHMISIITSIKFLLNSQKIIARTHNIQSLNLSIVSLALKSCTLEIHFLLILLILVKLSKYFKIDPRILKIVEEYSLIYQKPQYQEIQGLLGFDLDLTSSEIKSILKDIEEMTDCITDKMKSDCILISAILDEHINCLSHRDKQPPQLKDLTIYQDDLTYVETIQKTEDSIITEDNYEKFLERENKIIQLKNIIRSI